MIKGGIRIWAFLMVVAVIGLILLQYCYARNAYDLQEQAFDRNVQEALYQSGRLIEAEDAKNAVWSFFRTTNGDETYMMMDTTHRLRIHSQVTKGDTDERHIRQDVRIELDSLPMMKDSNVQAHIETRELIIRNGDTEMETVEEVEWVADKDSIVRVILSQMALGPRDNRERLDSSALHRTVRAELAQMGIRDSFQLSALDVLRKDTLFEALDPGLSTYSQTVFGPERGGPVTLLIQFPDRSPGGALGALLLSLSLALVILLAFGATLYAFFRQKRLSAMKSDFIHNMTHELKTPISTIALAGEALSDEDNPPDEEKVRRLAAAIRAENSRLQAQVERVLQAAQMDRGEWQPQRKECAPDALLRAEAERLSPLAEDRGGAIHLDLQADSARLTGDPEHLAAVFGNLIDNALKYSPEAPEVRLRSRITGGLYLLEVEDKGRGMSREVQARIFDRFYRAPTGRVHDVKGFGLGLSYALDIVRAHGGTIEVKSEPGKGSQFTLRLPLNRKGKTA